MRKNQLTVEWAKVLMDYGICLVPMFDEDKIPMISINDYPKGLPLAAMQDLAPQNISALTGMDSRLMVLDLDGPKELVNEWFKNKPALPKTWMVRTGSGGLHIWFRYPDWITRPVPNCQVWRGAGRHEELAVLGSRKLATCPPTRYSQKKVYRWAGATNPLKSKCAVAPYWLLHEIFSTKVQQVSVKIASGERFPTFNFAPSEEIPDRLQILIRAGLRLAQTKPNSSGWISCYRPGDESDRRPSASVYMDGSRVWVAGTGTLDFWSALVALKAFPTVEAAVAAIRGI